MGGHLNAYTSREQTCYYAKVGWVAADAGLISAAWARPAKHDVLSVGRPCQSYLLSAACEMCVLKTGQHAAARCSLALVVSTRYGFC